MTELTNLILQDSYTKIDALATLRAWRQDMMHEKYQENKKGGKWEEGDFEEAEKEIENADVLTIYSAVDLGEEERQTVGKKLRKDRRGLLVDFKVDASIVAGCKLVWGGQVKDYSLKKAIEEKVRQLIN